MIFLILFSGLILRLISLNQSLWLDEAINILAARNYSLFEIITQYAKADFHPPGYFIIIWIWGRIFNFSEISMRFPSIIFALLTIYIVYKIGKNLVSKRVGLISAALLAVNPLHIYYSQEARMYSFAAFAVTLSMFLFVKLVKGERVGLIHLAAANLLVLLSDYVAYLIFPAQVILVFFLKSKYLKKWLIGLFISVLAMLVWFPVFVNQLQEGFNVSSNIPAWTQVVGSSNIKALLLTFVKFIIGRISFQNELTYGLIFLPVGLVFLFFYFGGWKNSDKFSKTFLSAWLFIPIAMAFLISFKIPLFSYFRLLFVLPGFLIFIALGIAAFKSWRFILSLCLVLLIEFISTFVYLFVPTFQREDWRGLVKYLKAQPDKFQVIFESSGSFAPFDYYADISLKKIGALKNFPAKSFNDLIDLNSAAQSNDVYLVNYLVEISDPNRLVQKQLIDLNFSQSEILNFNGVGFVYHYEKIK